MPQYEFPTIEGRQILGFDLAKFHALLEDDFSVKDMLSQDIKSNFEPYLTKPFNDLLESEKVSLMIYSFFITSKAIEKHFKTCVETTLQLLDECYNESKNNLFNILLDAVNDLYDARKIYQPLLYRLIEYSEEIEELIILDFCCFYNSLVEGIFRRVAKSLFAFVKLLEKQTITYIDTNSKGTFNLYETISSFKAFPITCLTTGYNNKLRNSCGHPDYETREEYLIFKDRGKVVFEITFEEFLQYFLDLMTSMSAFMCGVNIFLINHSNEYHQNLSNLDPERVREVLSIECRKFDIEVKNVERKDTINGSQINVDIVLINHSQQNWLNKTILMLKMISEIFQDDDQLLISSFDENDKLIGMSMPVPIDELKDLAPDSENIQNYIEKHPPQYLYSLY